MQVGDIVNIRGKVKYSRIGEAEKTSLIHPDYGLLEAKVRLIRTNHEAVNEADEDVECRVMYVEPGFKSDYIVTIPLKDQYRIGPETIFSGHLKFGFNNGLCVGGDISTPLNMAYIHDEHPSLKHQEAFMLMKELGGYVGTMFWAFGNEIRYNLDYEKKELLSDAIRNTVHRYSNITIFSNLKPGDSRAFYKQLGIDSMRIDPELVAGPEVRMFRIF